jgi:hypothetical protein
MTEAELIFTALAELSTRQIAETTDATGLGGCAAEGTPAAKCPQRSIFRRFLAKYLDIRRRNRQKLSSLGPLFASAPSAAQPPSRQRHRSQSGRRHRQAGAQTTRKPNREVRGVGPKLPGAQADSHAEGSAQKIGWLRGALPDPFRFDFFCRARYLDQIGL